MEGSGLGPLKRLALQLACCCVVRRWFFFATSDLAIKDHRILRVILAVVNLAAEGCVRMTCYSLLIDRTLLI